MIPADKIRISGSKVRTGCITCKARHVKCDEARPACLRCTKGDRTCVYPPLTDSTNDPKRSTIARFINYGSPALPPSSRPYMSSNEQRATSYFERRVSIELGTPFATKMWTKSFMLMLEHEPAVRYGVIALANFHEAFANAEPITSNNKNITYAWESYLQMISESKQLTQSNSQRATRTALVTCLLFYAIESLRGRLGPAISFVKQGINLLSSASVETSQANNSQAEALVDIHELTPVFINLSTQCMAIADMGESDCASIAANCDESLLNHHFRSIDEALGELSALLNDLMRFKNWIENICQQPDYPDSNVLRAESILQARYNSWTQAHNNLLANLTDISSTTNPQEPAILILRINQLICQILLTTSCSTTQTAFDPCLPLFREINHHASRFLQLEYQQSLNHNAPSSSSSSSAPFTFNITIGIIPALYIVSTRCRDPTTRHHALHLLRSTRRKEGIWDAVLIAHAAAEFIALEEQSARAYREMVGRTVNNHVDNGANDGDDADEKPIDAADLPEWARIDRGESSFGDEGEVGLTFVRTTGERSLIVEKWPRVVV